jgi:cell division protein FtsB
MSVSALGLGMSLVVEVKRRSKAAVAPAVFLSLVAYFLWQAQQGERGLNTWTQRQRDLKVAQADLVQAEGEIAAWERRVQSLRSSPLDRDTLDERARQRLNLSVPSDVIVLYPQGQWLY